MTETPPPPSALIRDALMRAVLELDATDDAVEQARLIVRIKAFETAAKTLKLLAALDPPVAEVALEDTNNSADALLAELDAMQAQADEEAAAFSASGDRFGFARAATDPGGFDPERLRRIDRRCASPAVPGAP